MPPAKCQCLPLACAEDCQPCPPFPMCSSDFVPGLTHCATQTGTLREACTIWIQQEHSCCPLAEQVEAGRRAVRGYQQEQQQSSIEKLCTWKKRITVWKHLSSARPAFQRWQAFRKRDTREISAGLDGYMVQLPLVEMVARLWRWLLHASKPGLTSGRHSSWPDKP